VFNDFLLAQEKAQRPSKAIWAPNLWRCCHKQ